MSMLLFLGSRCRWTHAINSMETYEGIMANCNFSLIGPLYDAERDGVNNAECNKYCDLAMQQMGNINIVCLLWLFC